MLQRSASSIFCVCMQFLFVISTCGFLFNLLSLNLQQWDSDLVEARYIKDLDDNLSIIRLKFGDNSKPLFRNREFIVYERRETMEDGTLVGASHFILLVYKIHTRLCLCVCEFHHEF